MELDQQILTCYQHVTPISIAKMLDISYNKVYLILLNEGINIEPKPERNRKPETIELENIIRSCVGNMTWVSIARVLGISYEVVYHYITVRFGINAEISHRRNPNFVSQAKPKKPEIQHVRRFKYKNTQLV
jgi:transposase-like protein